MNENKIQKFHEKLKEKNLTIVCAESITAGLLSSSIASISGASDILLGSIVTYNRSLKTSILGVDPRIIDKHSPESIETTVEMSYGLTKIYPNASLYVAVTGVASESSPNYPVKKEVGQIYVAIYYKNEMHRYDEIIGASERNEIRSQTVGFILNKVLEIVESAELRPL